MTDQQPEILTDEDWDSLDRFARVAHANARARGFHDTADRLKAVAEIVRTGGHIGADPEVADLIISSYHGNRLMLGVGELVEAHEELRHGKKVDEAYEIKGKPEGVPSEIADEMIRMLDTSGENNIVPSEHMRPKMEFNSTRPRLHGGKSF